MTFDIDTVPVVFNMDLANGRTGARFCREAVAVLELSPHGDVAIEVGALTDDSEYLSEVIEEMNDRLDGAGYYARWDAGDVIVFDLRALSDDEREVFFELVQ